MKKAFKFTFCILLFAFCIFISDTASVRAEASSATEVTDVYWYVKDNNLLLSSEQGNSGFYKWSKESIAEVNNASAVPWNSSRDNITNVIIYEPIAPPSTAFWFNDTNLTSFSATADGTVYLDMRFTTDVSRMFAGCSELEELNLSGVNAPLVKNIESAFDGCSKIKTLDISCFDGAPITNMMNAFYGCSQLESLDISCFDGAPIVDMLNAFYGCSKIKALDVSGLDISRVTDFSGVFRDCTSLKSLDLSELDGRKITTLEDSFNGCSSLTSLTFGDNFTCENVTNMKNTFKNCQSLLSLDISGFSTSKVTDMSGTFSSCKALEEITFGEGFVCSNVTNMEKMFSSCNALKSIDPSSWGAVNVKNMNGLFLNCSSLETVDLSGFSGAEPTDIRSMFEGAGSLKSVDLSVLNTSKVTALSYLFQGCASLESVNLSSIDTSAVTMMDRVFENCTSLTSFSFAGVDTSQVETMDSMFHECKKLASVDLSGIDSDKVTDIDNMFYGCSALKRLDLTDFDIAEELSSTNFVRNCSMLEMIYTPQSIPETVSISLGYLTFYTGEEEITELTNDNQGSTVIRKFDISYSWKNGTQITKYEFEPSYYYYGYGATINATVSEDGYVFEGWKKKDSNEIVTEITATDAGTYILYAKLTAYSPVAPVISSSDDVIVSYGDGFEVNVSFAEDEYHTYWIEWYRTTWRESAGGVQVTGLRNTRGFTIKPKHFEYGIEIEKEVYFYCTVKATRKDNGLATTVSSPSIKVYVERAQAEITLHPTAIEGLIFNGSPQAVSTFGESNFGNVAYSFYESEGFTQANNKQTNAGSGILYYRVFDGIYYKGTELYTLVYNIEAATPTFSWNEENVTVDYTGKEAIVGSPSVHLLNSDVYDGAISYSYSGTSSGTGLPVNAGTYGVIASIAAGGNYTAASSEPLTLVINKVKSEFVKEPSPIEGLVYNGDEQALTDSGEAIGGTVEFSLDESSWSSDIPKGKNAGEYTVYYRIKGDNNHIDGSYGSLNASIGRKNITVTADDKVICVSSICTLTYGVDGLVNGDTLTAEVTLNTEANFEIPGDYVITVSGEETVENYTVTYENGTLTVSNHAYNNGEVTKKPNCDAEGEMTYTCLRDSNHTYTEPLPVDDDAHEWNEGVVTTDPTCSAVGVRTFTCKHNSAHTKTEDVAIDKNAHEWNAGAVTTDPTCSAVGVRTFTCKHNDEHTKTEDIDALEHRYDNACDTACNVCTEARTPAEHSDANGDSACDECGAELPKDSLSGGAITGIALGITAVIGLGGFSLFWFVIKKKGFSELIAIFKKK